MAQFLGSVRGQRGEATRLGSKQSGLVVNANGWNAGVRVVAEHVDGQDVFHVFATGGSSYSGRRELIAIVRDGDDKPSDTQFLNAIANLMSGKEWSPDTLEEIADMIRASGRKVADSSDIDA